MQVFSQSCGTRFLFYLLFSSMTHYSTSDYSGVVIRDELCTEELSSIQRRHRIVGDCLRRNGIDSMYGELPRIALMGSGGGERALIAFLGVLRQLGQDNLLDCFLYLAGVSGSTWAMASIYDHAHWSKNVTNVTEQVLNSISKGKGVTFSEGVQWLRKRHEAGDLSLSDPWGVMVCDLKGVPLETRTLSDDGNRHRDGANPYPLYSAIDRTLYNKRNMKDLWFELSPHESGFTEPGAFVKTSLLKQNFEGGYLQYSPNRKPMDMVELQGICGGVFGDEERNKLFIKTYILNWIKSLHARLQEDDSTSAGGAIQIMMIMVELVENMDDVERCRDLLAILKFLFGESKAKFSSPLLNLYYKLRINFENQKRKEYVEKIFEELIHSFEQWGQDLFKVNQRHILTDVWWVIKHILPLFPKWQFGNVANFLFKLNDTKIPEEMRQKDTMHLIDAGLFLDSPYPSVLREARDVDVIVSVDFSEDDPFGTLKGASAYAAANNRPFPKIDFDTLDSNRPDSFYVFEEEGRPTVIHMPLFNIDNCKDESTISQEWKEYATFQMTYRDKSKIDHLARLAAENARINREGILNEIRKATQRRRNTICQFVHNMHSCRNAS